MITSGIKTAILVNLDANDGRASRRWKKISASVLNKFCETETVEYNTPFDIKECLSTLINGNQVKAIISAGGDGSANIILNELMNNHRNENISLGFIGLGSSNDILKPNKQFINKIPVQLDIDRAIRTDVGCINYFGIDQTHKQKYFLSNSSLGLGASANQLFNHEDRIIRSTKSRLTNLAILYTIIKTILTYKNYPAQIEFKDHKKDLSVSYIVVLKNPHISGYLKFDQNLSPSDGMLSLNICEGMNKKELIKLLFDLSNGRFGSTGKRESYSVADIKITTSDHVPLEMDGEVVMAKDISYSVIKAAINVMQ
ncbi:MAG: hypothetical protein HKN92_04170 [Chitinophagales bacterium]|nr:hypothetical protein [Chitinophagales bacterium]